MSDLFNATTIDGTPTWRANNTCSRVCGIGPSVAATTKNRAIDLRRTRDHVLDVISMTRHINVGIVTILRLVLNMRNRDRDTTRLLLRRLINTVEVRERQPSHAPTASSR